MPRTVHCIKLGHESEALDRAPFKGELGQRVFQNVSKQGWRMWLEHSKMLINEYRLDLMSPRAKTILREQCEAFFFGEGAQLPPDFVPPKAK